MVLTQSELGVGFLLFLSVCLDTSVCPVSTESMTLVLLSSDSCDQLVVNKKEKNVLLEYLVLKG